jgi:Fe-Mn family superoxide dismutase
MSYQLMQLPYSAEALAPYISSETISFHYEKHHRAYLNNLNDLLENADKEWESLSLKEVLLKSHKTNIGIFNNAAQVWNHDFYWLSMKPNGGNEPKSVLYDAIKKDFGNFEAFKKEFIKSGMTQFGSGWIWLVKDKTNGKLSIIKTGNADNPLLQDQIPLITCDVWEHAYYIDYRNKRVEYLEIFLDKLVNWEFAEKNFVL